MKKETKEIIRDFIIDTFLMGKGSIKDDDSLFERNVIDSFGLLELIAFIEKQFNIRVHPGEIRIENFDSLKKIVKLVIRRQNKS